MADENSDLFGDRDATHWAERFVQRRRDRIADDGYDIGSDEGTMRTWFAAAIETGVDLGQAYPVTLVVRQLIEALAHNYGAAFIAQLAREAAEPTPIMVAAAAAMTGDGLEKT